MNLIESEPDVRSEVAGELPRESGTGERFISFELGERLFCVPAASVAEVVHPMSVASVPKAPAWLAGLAPHRGEPVAVIDAATVAGAGYRPANGKSKIIVFRARRGEMQFALPIDSLHEVIASSSFEFGNDEHGTAPNERFYNGRPVRIVDHNQLFDSFGNRQ